MHIYMFLEVLWAEKVRVIGLTTTVKLQSVCYDCLVEFYKCTRCHNWHRKMKLFYSGIIIWIVSKPVKLQKNMSLGKVQKGSVVYKLVHQVHCRCSFIPELLQWQLIKSWTGKGNSKIHTNYTNTSAFSFLIIGHSLQA